MAAVGEGQQGNPEGQTLRRPNAPLDIKDFLNGLVTEGRITQSDSDLAISSRHAPEHRAKHLLHFIADLNLADQKTPGRNLDI